jgi:hypothetical protein
LTIRTEPARLAPPRATIINAKNPSILTSVFEN